MKDKTLNTKQLIKDSNCRLRILGSSIFFLTGFLLLLAPFLFELSKTNLIISEIFLFTVFTLPFSLCIGLRLLINATKEYKILKLGNFLILLDKILYIKRSSVEVSYEQSEGIPHTEYFSHLSLEKYTASLKGRLRINIDKLDGVKEGDPCILIFSQNKVEPFLIYPGKNIVVEESLQKNIVGIDEIVSQINLKENKNTTPKTPGSLKTLTIKTLLKDSIDKSQQLTTLFISFLVLVLTTSIFLLLTSDIIEFSFIVYFLLFLILLFLITWDVLKIKYLLKIKKHIKEKNFSLKRDIVIQEKIDKAYGSKVLKFKNYKKNVYFDETTDEFFNAKVDDEFYMLFIKGESKPIKIYNSKNVIISDELYDYVK